MVAQAGSRPMRGRLHFLAPLAVLALIPPGLVGLAGANDDDPCLNPDPNEVLTNTANIINIADECTFQFTATNGQYTVTVDVGFTHYGTLFIRVTAGPANDQHEVVYLCTPRYGSGGFYYNQDCWVDTHWLN